MRMKQNKEERGRQLTDKLFSLMHNEIKSSEQSRQTVYLCQKFPNIELKKLLKKKISLERMQNVCKLNAKTPSFRTPLLALQLFSALFPALVSSSSPQKMGDKMKDMMVQRDSCDAIPALLVELPYDASILCNGKQRYIAIRSKPICRIG